MTRGACNAALRGRTLCRKILHFDLTGERARCNTPTLPHRVRGRGPTRRSVLHPPKIYPFSTSGLVTRTGFPSINASAFSIICG